MSKLFNEHRNFICKRCGVKKSKSPLYKDGMCDTCNNICHAEKFRAELDSISPDIGEKHFVYALNVHIDDYTTPILTEDYILIKIDDDIRKHLSNLLDIVGLDVKQDVTVHSKYLLATNFHLNFERVECHLHNRFSTSCEFSRSAIFGLQTGYADWSFRHKSVSNILVVTLEGIEEILIFQSFEKITGDDTDVQFILNLLEETEGCLFRGINNHYHHDDGIAASIYRNNKDLVECGKLQDHEKEITEKLIEFDSRTPEKPTISALTDLRHHGKDTCLLDFSEDLKIALFFSCQPTTDNSAMIGEVLVLRKSKYEQKEEDFLIEPAKTEVTRNRVEAQKSVFLYCYQGYLPRETTQEKVRNLLIAPQLKSWFYNYCEYTDETVFPDFYAFISNPANFITVAKRECQEN